MNKNALIGSSAIGDDFVAGSRHRSNAAWSWSLDPSGARRDGAGPKRLLSIAGFA
jgi:hypothetical protein